MVKLIYKEMHSALYVSKTLALVLAFLLEGSKGVAADEGYLFCVNEADSNSSVAAFPGSIVSTGTPNQKVEHCGSTSNACFALWEFKQEADGNYTPVVLRKGCWNPSDSYACESDTCSGGIRSFGDGRQNLSFCCCQGNMCNLSVNYTVEFAKDEPVLVTTVVVAEPRGANVILCVMGALVVVLAAGVVVMLRKLCSSRKKSNSRLSMDSEERHSLMESFDSKDLRILETIGHGRYGTVWRGTLVADRDVAVKVFNPQSQNYFFNERDIYCLPLMEHPNIVGYLGCDERITQNDFVEHRIFLNYHPIGCIQDYLRNNSLDWSVFCKMGQSVSRGLSHLHTYIKKGDCVKPSISHRDINSRNVLVKSDLSLCICDMGFAMQINGAHYVFSGEQQHAETESLTDVGTLRYMAPEVLEGAVNLRECEAALKQIDVYALSLVLWELASRCHDLCISSQKVAAYKMPFEAELGPNIDFERLQNLVCRLKARPLFPEFWRENNPALRMLRETVEDCWDADAEARLTAVCVEERFTEMVTLWDRFKVHGNGLHSFGIDSLNDTVITRNSFSENKSFQLERSPGNTGDTTGSASFTTVDVALIENQNIQNREFDKNFNTEYPWLPQLQAYQGRNPCLERNTLNKEESDDLSVSGNALVPRSVKQAKLAIAAVERSSQLQSSTTDSNSSGAAHRILNPIPYVQNVMIEPKILNIPKSEEQKGSGNVVSWLLGAFGKKPVSGRNPVPHVHSAMSIRRNPVSSDTKESISSERSVQNVCVSSIPSLNSHGAIPGRMVSAPLVVHVPINEPEKCQDDALPLLEQVVIDRDVNVA